VFLDLPLLRGDEGATRAMLPAQRGNGRAIVAVLCVSWGIEFQAENTVVAFACDGWV